MVSNKVTLRQDVIYRHFLHIIGYINLKKKNKQNKTKHPFTNHKKPQNSLPLLSCRMKKIFNMPPQEGRGHEGRRHSCREVSKVSQAEMGVPVAMLRLEVIKFWDENHLILGKIAV